MNSMNTTNNATSQHICRDIDQCRELVAQLLTNANQITRTLRSSYTLHQIQNRRIRTLSRDVYHLQQQVAMLRRQLVQPQQNVQQPAFAPRTP